MTSTESTASHFLLFFAKQSRLSPSHPSTSTHATRLPPSSHLDSNATSPLCISIAASQCRSLHVRSFPVLIGNLSLGGSRWKRGRVRRLLPIVHKAHYANQSFSALPNPATLQDGLPLSSKQQGRSKICTINGPAKWQWHLSNCSLPQPQSCHFSCRLGCTFGHFAHL